MKVRVKQGFVGFFGGQNYREGSTFNIEAKTCFNRVDDKGKPIVLSENEQFSDKWMEVVDKPRAKPGPKPKVVD